QLRASLHAIHINHQLHADSLQWQKHCEQICLEWDVPLVAVAVEVAKETGKGLEAAAREARYDVFAEHLAPDDLLLLAHHENDQVETLLLNLFRGSGIDGLAGMPRERTAGRATLFRPLLEVSREQLEYYAKTMGLKWMEDPSNASQQFDRNFLRHSVLPLIEQRFPSAIRAMARSVRHQRWSAELLRMTAGQLTDHCLDLSGRLSIHLLKGCTDQQQVLILRH
ncbi:unnamed protein product, partial [Cyprideis torosa]